ncbi:MAG: small multi-drug export protein [Bacteroidales bacterium]|nr:small multi-drug export protein [Bacteroidales bacterium]
MRIKDYLYIFLIAMVPIVELRGAIPVAYTLKATTSPDLNIFLSYIVIAIGNMIPVPFIFFFARRILEWGKDKKVIGKFFTWCLKKGEKGGQKLQSKAGRGLYVALLLFVGIPLPGTGAWTGTLAASFLDMDFKKSVLAVVGGVVLASVIVGVLCTLGFGAWFGITGQ